MRIYTIKLSEDEVKELTKVISKGSHSSMAYRAAYVLLKSDTGLFATNSLSNKEISEHLFINERTVERIKKRFFTDGFDGILERKVSTSPRISKFDGDFEAKLIHICCTEAPEGFAKWSLRLLAEKVVELSYIDSVSHVSIGAILKKTNLSRGV